MEESAWMCMNPMAMLTYLTSVMWWPSEGEILKSGLVTCESEMSESWEGEQLWLVTGDWRQDRGRWVVSQWQHTNTHGDISEKTLVHVTRTREKDNQSKVYPSYHLIYFRLHNAMYLVVARSIWRLGPIGWWSDEGESERGPGMTVTSHQMIQTGAGRWGELVITNRYTHIFTLRI